MKKVVIIFSVLLMISGATISIMKSMKLGPFAENTGEETVEENPPEPEEPPIFVEMEEMSIPLFADDKLAATVVITLNIVVQGVENEQLTIKFLPRLKDAFIRDLHAFIPRVVRQENRLSQAVLKERLKLVGKKVLGEEIVKDIKILSVGER